MSDRKQIPLRLDPAVHEALVRWAADDLRSVNAQIEVLLRDSLKRAGRLPSSARPIRAPGRPKRGAAGEPVVESAEPDAGGGVPEAEAAADARERFDAEGGADAPPP